MKKRVLSLLLALCLVLGVLPLSALATAATDVPPASVTDIADPAPAAPEEEQESIVEEPPIDEDPAEEEGPVEEEPDEEEAPAEEEPDEEEAPAEEEPDEEEAPVEEEGPVEEDPAKEEAPIEEEPADEKAGIAPLAETEDASCLAVYEDAPTAATTKAGALYQLELDNVFCDTSNHALTYSLESSVSNDKTKIKDGVFYFSVPDTGDYVVTLKATCADGKSLSHQLTITVEAAAEGIAAQYGYSETAASSVTVYVTVSNDGMPLVGQDETVLSHLKVTVPYFDLGLYGLEDFYRFSTDGGKGPYTGENVIQRPTGLHLYIYLLERYYMGLSEEDCGKGSSGVLDFSGEKTVRYMDGTEAYESDGKQALAYTGSATSLYMVNFWGHDENLMYFRNHCYPLMSAGWGSTSDYILLSDGDTWDVAMFTNWSFYHSGWFARFDKDAYTVEAGKDLTLSTLKWGTTSEAVDFETISGLTVGLYDSDWTFVKEVAYTSGNSLSFTAPEKAGEYYLLAMDPNATDGTLAKGAPATARVTVTAATTAPVEPDQSDYELRVLTFEDADYKGSGNMLGNKDWSSLIDSPQYNGSLLYSTGSTVYNWYDQGNTELKHEIAENYGSHQYWGGGEAISNYNSGEIATYGNYEYQLTVYKKGTTGVATSGGGRGGSNNFVVHYGYTDNSGYSSSNLQCLTFGDGVARVIDHMYVNNTCYALNCFTNGNGLTESIGESDWVKLVATGHHADGTTATAEFYLCNGPENLVTDWTKWDLSGLGKITKLELNVTGSSDNGYGFSQPAYFAYDDVAVRFEESTEEPASQVAFSIDLSACGDAVTGTYLAMDAEDEEKYEEKALTSGSKNEFSSETGAYGFYCVELKTAKSSNITGWKVNGTEYALSSESKDYPLDNDVCITIGTGETDDILQFDLTLGAENMAYATESTWEIVPVLHTCVFDKEVATEAYLASAATCKDAATYYRSCECGKHGTEVFSSGELGEHKDENGDRVCDVCEESLNKAPTLIEGVTDVTAKIQTSQGYQLKDLENGKIFEDADGDQLTYASYFYKKSSDGGETWSELTGFTAALFGGNDMTFVNDKEGTYIYEFWAYDGYEYSEASWTLTLIVMDVVPADINFYVGYDQNYVKANYEAGTYKYPVLELYRTAGIDDDFNDYIGWFTNAEDETVYVYHPQEYTIAVDGEKAYVELGESRYELHDYEKLTFTNSSFYDADEAATPSNTVVGNYNMFYVSLETGRYSTRFYGYNSNTGAYDIYLGGQSMALPMELDIYGGGGNDLYFRVVSIYTTSKMLDGNYFTAEDYDAEISMPITGSNIQHGYPYVESGKTYYPFMSWANGNGSVYAAYVYPKDTENYVFNQAINQTTVAGASVVTKNLTISTALALSVTVPESGDFGLYFQYNNFNTSVVAPRSEAVSNGDGTKTLVYNVSKGSGNYTWRLTDPTGAHVTNGGWLKSITAATEMTFTFSEQTNSKSHSFSNLGTTVATRDEADIQLFASHSGFLSISGTKRIRAYRMWELINSDTANIMVEPDYNVQFLQGNSSDLKQVDGGNGGGNWLDVTPTSTDIIAVSYDAIDMYADTGTHNTHGGFFPATNPERTAVMVVTNGSSGSADATIAFNGSKETSRGDEWDYNYDTWFYMDTDEAPTLDFTVSGNGNVSVSYANVITSSNLVSSLSDWTTITADEDGYYHTDLLAFRDAGTLGGTVIIKMVDATGTSYRLVRVAQMSVTIANVSFPGEAPTAGDQVKLTFDGLYRSVNKISGVFNPTIYYLRYTQDGTEVNGQLGQYQQMDRASITLTIPENVEVDEDGKASYTFTNGYIWGEMYSATSPFSTMYGMTDTGVGTNFSAVYIKFALSRLADVTVEVGTKTSYDITLDVTEGASPLTGYTFTLVSPDGETLTPDESGIYKNLPWGVYSYTLTKSGYLCVTGTQTIGESYTDLKDDNGLVHWAFTLEKGVEGCWDGTKSEPSQIDGVYQIGTGAELAWFADYVNAGNASVSAVLTADIDLAKFPWTPIGNSKTKFSGSFDGQNHTISNLLLSYSSTASTSPYLGLFGYVQGASATNMASIANLTVSGNVTATSTASVSQANSAAVIGYAKYATVSKVHNKADVTITRVNGTWNYAGGVLGKAENCTIIGCTNSGSLYGYNYMAGVAGYINSVTMEDCANYGTVQANSYAAGIAGQSTGTSVISLCYNQGTIQCASGNAGGIAGRNSATITTSYNLADVTSLTYAGGIAGYNQNATITNTYNTGKVSATGNYVGAIAGYGTTNTKTTIDRNYYLEGTWSVGIGYIGTNRNNTVDPVAISQSDLTSKAFVALLNGELEEDAFGMGQTHPLLLWQDGAVAIVPGDLNGDGNVDTNDVVVLLQVINSAEEAQEDLDLNEDGNLDMKDIVILLQLINTTTEA